MSEETQELRTQIEDVQIKVPSTGDVGADTVEGGRGGELQFSTESPGHL